MHLQSDYSKKKIIKILSEQVDDYPNLFRCLISLNAHRYVGTSKVCGIITDNRIELYNRKDPYLSLCAKINIYEEGTETIIDIVWVKRKGWLSLINIIFERYKNDKNIILNFLYEWLNTNVIDLRTDLSLD